MATGFYDVPPRLPHDPIPLATILIVETALCVAWELLLEQPQSKFNIATDNEDRITLALQQVLVDEVFSRGLAPGFNSDLFTVVVREPKVANFDGNEPDKMPDLLIGFVGREVSIMTQDWLFIECKPVDSKHTVGACYCSNGMIRFIDGRYAWAMTEALMIGYVKSGYSIIPKLQRALKKPPAGIVTLDYPAPCSQSQPHPYSEIVHISRHQRSYSYVETGHAAPDITIRHLWLKRD